MPTSKPLPALALADLMVERHGLFVATTTPEADRQRADGSNPTQGQSTVTAADVGLDLTHQLISLP